METQTALDDLSNGDTTETEAMNSWEINNDYTDENKSAWKNNGIVAGECKNVTSAKKVTFQEEDVRLLDDGIDVDNQARDEMLLDCDLAMQNMGRQNDNSGINIAKDIEAQVQEAYLSCTDNDSESDSDSEEDLLFIE
jgi:hypothetical protein